MSSRNNLRAVTNTAGFTAVNPRFSFSNGRLLSSVASSDKNQESKSKNVLKVVDPAADAARFIPPTPSIVNRETARTARTTIPGLLTTEVRTLLEPPRTPPFVPPRTPAIFDPIFSSGSIAADRTRAIIDASSRRQSGSIIPQSLPIDLPPSVDSSITLYSTIPETERSIFNSGSFLVSGVSFDEKFVGKKLQPEEKPRVLATVEEKIVDGYPKANTIIFKKITTNSGYATKYIIYRKNIFKDVGFKKLVELEPESLTIPADYEETISQLGLTPNQCFIVRDLIIKTNAVYAYKVEVEWVSTAPRQASFVPIDASRVAPIVGDLASQLSRFLTTAPSASSMAAAPAAPATEPAAGNVFSRFGRIS